MIKLSKPKDMNEWFCEKCHHVFLTGRNEAECCSIKAVIFDMDLHGRYLIGLSNSWIAVDKKWRNNPLRKKIALECMADGCYGSATILNVFIEQLYDFYKSNNNLT